VELEQGGQGRRDGRHDHAHRQEPPQEPRRLPEEIGRVLRGRPQAKGEDHEEDAGRDRESDQLSEIHR
jgi:hypothetical protein